VGTVYHGYVRDEVTGFFIFSFSFSFLLTMVDHFADGESAIEDWQCHKCKMR
jgi:hypothetical protein